MDSVVATVTGYHGSERFKLIKLISHAGANYVGAMSPSITHLVCWKFEGKKYELAQKFGTKVVNHRWIEDCIKQGKRVPEGPYTRRSGEEVGPLVLEVPADTEAESSRKKAKVLSDRSNTSSASREDEFDAGCGGSDLWDWVKSPSLNEELLPHGRSNGGSDKLKSKPVRRAAKENWSSGRKFEESPLSGGSRGKEPEEPRYPIQSRRGKTKTRTAKKEEPNFQPPMQSLKQGKITYYGTKGRCLAESSGKGRRLVKKNVDRDMLDTELADTSEDYPQTTVPKRYNKAGSSSIHILDEGNDDICDLEGTSDHNFMGIIHIDDEIEEIRARSPSPGSKNSNSSKDEASASKRVSGEGCSISENINKESQDLGQTEHGTSVPFPVDTSCAICWTDEFNPTRGILPCGHRYCYECIQHWADCKIAERKVPHCPYCQQRFTSITKVEDAPASDQKIYSQTIPCFTSTDNVIHLPTIERHSFTAQSLPAGCIRCRSREPEELLIYCDICQLRKIHSYCLDPFVSPWICIHCRDLPML